MGQTTYVTFRLVYSYNLKAIWKTKEVTYTRKLHTVLHRFTGAPVLVIKNKGNSTKSTVFVFAVFVRVPTQTGNLENLENGKAFSSQGKVREF